MRMRSFGFVIVVAAFALAAPALGQEGHPLKGTWLGEWGTQKTPVFLVLDWNGEEVTGAINPGPGAAAVRKVSLTPPAAAGRGVRGAPPAAAGSNDWVINLEAEGRPADPTLRRGASGEPVRRLQQMVGAEVDGVFGPQTEAALKKFQLAQGLAPDGVAGPATWAAGAATSQPVRYVIDGKIENISVANRSIVGTWSENGRKGELRIVRQ